MQEKKTLFRKEDRKERRTVESYTCACVCSCTCSCTCNPCDSSPSSAYLTRRDSITKATKGPQLSSIAIHDATVKATNM